MSTTSAPIKLVGPVGLTCPSCGSGAGVYAAMFPVFAYGVDGGSSDIDHYECSTCEHEWSAP